MEIIDELEPHRRGPYAGAVGYVDFNGNMDTCIALRTMVVQGDKAYMQAGAGIVADSVPANEWQETLNKARGLLKAIELAAGAAEGRRIAVRMKAPCHLQRPCKSTRIEVFHLTLPWKPSHMGGTGVSPVPGEHWRDAAAGQRPP